jgi:hypothetical protein
LKLNCSQIICKNIFQSIKFVVFFAIYPLSNFEIV